MKIGKIFAYYSLFLIFFPVDLHEILEQLQSVSKMNDLKLCEVCKPGTFENVKDINAYVPAVTAFGIPQHLLKEVQDINRY